ncbi:MAG: molybdopterin-binding protein [Aestuariivita sp.]|nr:molybdopterin-binding protein [Aestuariivita sp.]MCY4345773.1 molybdopterin-binding protein [Aestuariivita sp.]
MSNPTAAMVVIGDEILSGRTKDTNVSFLAAELTQRGIDLREVRIIPDEREAIIGTLKVLATDFDHVFTSGGIGPTHDDITADCVAAAFDRPISVRADARLLLERHYQNSGLELNEARLRMARIPEAAVLIANPVSTAPGFSLENVHVMAGVPAVFKAMVTSLLPTLRCGKPVLQETLRVMRPEGDLAPILESLARKYWDLSIGCYPFQSGKKYGANVVIRGASEDRIKAALTNLVKEIAS